MVIKLHYVLIRVEFQNFRLAGPNPRTTMCEEDYFAVSGNAFKTPKLCGDSYTDQTSTLIQHFIIRGEQLPYSFFTVPPSLFNVQLGPRGHHAGFLPFGCQQQRLAAEDYTASVLIL